MHTHTHTGYSKGNTSILLCSSMILETAVAGMALEVEPSC